MHTLCTSIDAQSVFIASSTQALSLFFKKAPVRLALPQPVYFNEFGSSMTLNICCLLKN